MPLFPDMKKNVLLIVKYKKPFFKNTGQQNIYVTQLYPDRNYSNTSICLILPDFDRSEKATKEHDFPITYIIFIKIGSTNRSRCLWKTAK
jgi:hypothetical protein